MTNGVTLEPREYQKLAALLTRWTGINLHAKQHLMLGRLQPRLRALDLPDFAAYLAHLELTGANGSEAQQFINALTTNKTAFFREAHHFDFLVRRLFPELRARAQQSGVRRLRLWSAGCSRGAEPYSMAMLAAEHLPVAEGWDVKILATDLDTDVLAEAERGVYESAEIDEVPAALRKRYFERRDADHHHIIDAVGALVTFAQANLVLAPFPVRGRFDAIFCRNVMIYFDRATQQRIVHELVARVGTGGYLVIGHSESMVAQHLPREQETVGVYRPDTGRLGTLAPPSAAAPQALARIRASVRPPAALPKTTRPSSGEVTHAAPVRARSPVPGMPIRRIVLGECFATHEPVLIATLLGSCVSACLFDSVARVGGMNHFMLPRVLHDERGSARFGIHAMELLINQLMQLGAQRSRLRAMAFGAGNINRALAGAVSAQNGEFVRSFLAKEQIPLVCERLGGDTPREVYLRTDTGEAYVRIVETNRVGALQRSEQAAYAHAPSESPVFDPDQALF